MDFLSRYEAACQELVEACRYIAAKGLTSSSGGNLSIRVEENCVLITPTGMPKELVSRENLCAVDIEGRTLYAPEGFHPTSETPFHTMFMRERNDIVSVVHAHPVELCAFSILKSRLLELPFFPEEAMEIGPIVTVPYEEPSCDKLADAIAPYAKESNGFILENHGAVAVSQHSVMDAVERLNLMESTAASVKDAALLGQLKVLTKEQVEALETLKITRGQADDAKPISKAFIYSLE